MYVYMYIKQYRCSCRSCCYYLLCFFNLQISKYYFVSEMSTVYVLILIEIERYSYLMFYKIHDVQQCVCGYKLLQNANIHYE